MNPSPTNPSPDSGTCDISDVSASGAGADTGETAAPVTLVFVYGTLRVGDVRWHLMEPFTTSTDSASRFIAATVPGQLYDTGEDYPAGVFDPAAATPIIGELHQLDASRLVEALEFLDDVEGTVVGAYHRVLVHATELTSTGSTHRAAVQAWAYQCGEHLHLPLTPIESGDWFQHRPPTGARLPSIE